MAIYKHEKTGEVVVTDSELQGAWKLVKQPKTKALKKE